MKIAIRVGTAFLLLLAIYYTCAEAGGSCSAVVAAPKIKRQVKHVEKLRESGRTRSAEKSATQLVHKHPKTFSVLYASALVQEDTGKLPVAEKQLTMAVNLQKACKNTPGFRPDYTVYTALGEVQMKQGKWGEAAKNYDLALKHASALGPLATARTKTNLGYLYFSMGNFSRAHSYWTEAAKVGDRRATNALKLEQRAQAVYERLRKPN